MNDVNPLKSRTYTRSRLVGSVRVADLVRTRWTRSNAVGAVERGYNQVNEADKVDFVD